MLLAEQVSRHDHSGSCLAPTTLRSSMILSAFLPRTPNRLLISSMTQSVLARCSGGSWKRRYTAMLCRLSHPVLQSPPDLGSCQGASECSMSLRGSSVQKGQARVECVAEPCSVCCNVTAWRLSLSALSHMDMPPLCQHGRQATGESLRCR